MGFFDEIGKVAGGVGDLVGSIGGGFANSVGKYAPKNTFNATTPGVGSDFGDKYNASYADNPDLLARRKAFLDQLSGVTNGTAPTASDRFFRNASDANTANQMALASSARGASNPGLAQRIAGQNIGQTNAVLAGQNAGTNLQEANQARALMGGALDQGLNMDNTMMEHQLAGNAEANKLNADVAKQNFEGQNKFTGGITSGLSGLMGTGATMLSGVSGGGAAGGAGAAAGGAGAAGTGGLAADASSAAMFAASGGVVPGRAPVRGDSVANDRVATMLSPGEVVIPRTIASHPGFLRALEHHMGGMHAPGFGSVVEARRRAKGRG